MPRPFSYDVGFVGTSIVAKNEQVKGDIYIEMVRDHSKMVFGFLLNGGLSWMI